jgi:hypothetical protein
MLLYATLHACGTEALLKELTDCIQTDPHNKAQYRAVFYRNGCIEGDRFLRYMLDTQQLQDFAAWEKSQQATQLASYRTGENHSRVLRSQAPRFYASLNKRRRSLS